MKWSATASPSRSLRPSRRSCLTRNTATGSRSASRRRGRLRGRSITLERSEAAGVSELRFFGRRGKKRKAVKIFPAAAMHRRAPRRPTPRHAQTRSLAMADLSRTPVTLIGASRGLGRVLAETFHRLRAQTLVVARGQAGLDAVARDLPGVATLACDASADDAPARVFAVQAPHILVLCRRPMPPCLPFPEVDWAAFSGNWNNDVRMSFHFLQAALKRPLPRGATIVTISSGAVRQGSPISGGYARARQMHIVMSGHAQ